VNTVAICCCTVATNQDCAILETFRAIGTATAAATVRYGGTSIGGPHCHGKRTAHRSEQCGTERDAKES
jgi:hypothetical protein